MGEILLEPMKTLFFVCACFGLLRATQTDAQITAEDWALLRDPGEPHQYRRLDGEIYNVVLAERWTNMGGIVVDVLTNTSLRWTNSAGKILLVSSNELVLEIWDVPSLRHFALLRAPDRGTWSRKFQERLFYGRMYPVGEFRWPGRAAWWQWTKMPAYDYGQVVSEYEVRRTLAVTNIVDDVTESRVAEWTRKQALSGQVWAQYDLGIRLRDGRGVAADPAQARRWLKAAADQGHDQAKAALSRLPP